LTFTGISLRAAAYTVAQRDPKAGDDGPGSAERPWRSLNKAAENAEPGDIVSIRDGVYREQVVVKASGTAERPIRFQAAPGAHIVLTGADRLTGWQRVEGDRPIYRVPWPHRFITWSRHNAHPDDLYHRLIGRCEQVAVDGYLLRQVPETSQLGPGTFSVDPSNQVLQVWDPANRDLNKVFVEGSTRQEILRLAGARQRGCG
jgi:hypothetical protein